MKIRGLAFAAIPLAFVVGCGSSGSGAVAPAAAVSTAGPLAGLPTNPPTTEPPAPVAVQTPDVKAAVRAWALGGGLAKIDGLTSAMGQVAASGKSGDSTATRAACVQLTVATAGAENYGPIPETSVEQHWMAGLTALSSAAVDCAAGIDSGNAALLNHAGDEENQGTVELTQATKLLNAL
jgi:hypothetical protein